jgi:putative pyruvate formate lyase activating enzyme
METFKPRYLKTFDEGLLNQKIEASRRLLSPCVLCPRKCRADRLKDERGKCKTGRSALISSFNPHFGEEAPLVGTGGSGTIFFANCNLLCIFCQNFDISHLENGEEKTPDQIAHMMLFLQNLGCHNIIYATS